MIKGKEYRALYKAYGIRFLITVTGEGRKFDILRFTITLGTGIELLGLSVLIGDMVLLKFTRSKRLYKSVKELNYKKEKVETVERIEDIAKQPLGKQVIVRL